MRWIKTGVFLAALLAAVYAVSLYYFAEESKTFKGESEINYPLDKVYPQFSNFQNFTKWNQYFSDSKTMNLDYFSPYEGQGSAVSFSDEKKDRKGEMYLRYENAGKTLKYQLFEGENENPTRITFRFIPVSQERTKVKWEISTPKLSFWNRAANLWTDESFANSVQKSITGLAGVLGNKIDRDLQLASIKYDSIFVEQREGQLLLGVNVSTKNDKKGFYKNIALNYNKVLNYMQMDLGKNEDEYGNLVLVTDADSYKDKEVSYYLGAPVPKRISVSDNNFSFRTQNASTLYSVYYKGSFADRVKTIQQLLQKAQKETMRSSDVEIQFVEQPEENNDGVYKISLPVYR